LTLLVRANHNEACLMRIGLLADTHVPEAARRLPPQVAEAFRGVDLVLHAGDIYLLSVLDELERIAPVLAAKGDDDAGDTLTDRRVKRKHVLQLEGYTLWLMHEIPYARMTTPWAPRKARGSTDDPVPDIVVFGHDHCTIVERRNGVLFVNPGSPTFLNYRRGPGTVALLHIDSGEPHAEIVQLSGESPGP
jgi:putative phosphoesterase